MHRWNLPAIAAIIGCSILSSAARADEPAPAPRQAVAPPVSPVLMNADAYRSASPYNVTTVGRTIPNPAYNRPNMTLPCENSNQNFDSFVPAQPDCIKRIFGGSDCGGCSSCSGMRGKHAQGGISQGNCATCSNTYNFIWSGSRSFFGESSREFFERPPSVDAARHNWNPIPVLYRKSN
jgi:hypothetical protein